MANLQQQQDTNSVSSVLAATYFEAGTALRQLSLATGGTLTLKRSGKSSRTH